MFSEVWLPASGCLLCLRDSMGLLGAEIAFSGTDSSVSSLFLAVPSLSLQGPSLYFAEMPELTQAQQPQ